MIQRWSRRWAYILAAVLVAATGTPVQGQSAAAGALSGSVRDSAGLPLSQVLLTLEDETTGLRRTTYSGLDGSYRFGILPPGHYALSVEKLAFGPQRITGIPVRAAQELRVDAELRALDRGQTRPLELSVAAEATGSGRPGQTDRVTRWAVAELPHAQRQVGDLWRLLSRTDVSLGVEGLPAWLTGLLVDGTPFRPAAHPLTRLTPLGGVGFALAAFDAVELVTTGVDVEYGGAAGGWISGHSRRGSETGEAEARGAWSSSVLPGASFGDGLSYHGGQGSLTGRTALLGDSARLSAGVEVQRLQTPLSRRWDDSPAAVMLSGLGDSFGVDFAEYRRAALSTTEALAAHGRFDWHLGPRHQFAAWLQLASQQRMQGLEPRLGVPQAVEGTDVLVGGSLVSQFGARLQNVARVSLASSTRSTADQAPVAPSWIVSDGLPAGGLQGPASGEESRVTLSNAMHVLSGRHAVKVGAGLGVNAQRYQHRTLGEGEFYFGDANDVLARRGLVILSSGAAPAARWSTAAPFLFVQDRWYAGDGLDIVVGARVEHVPLPADRVSEDTEWTRLSGLANNQVTASQWRPEVRAGFVWDVQQSRRWIVHAGAGIHTDEVDPLLLNEWQSDAGTARVVRELGALAWPSGPAAGGSLRRVTMLAPGFTAPRTVRGAGGVSYRAATHTVLQLSAVTRRTENLPRRTDLNLEPLPSVRDQYGRPVFGRLIKQGAMIAAEPGSARRFPSYDEAAGINSDGWSEYWGVTFGIERAAGNGPAVLAHYTFSSTRDNWFGAREGGWTMSAPRGLDGAGEWAEGTSDFDTPHRLAAGVLVPLPFGAHVGVVYRGESGVPFTPGFRRGVDASGDGVMGNDPAFIDPQLEGMSGTLARWSCLAESSGRLAVRNSCRGPARHSVDLSVSVDVLRLGARRAALTAAAFDVFETAHRLAESALLLVDPDATLMEDAHARTVTVPLRVNPLFGEQLVRPHAGRIVRLGFSVTW